MVYRLQYQRSVLAGGRASFCEQSDIAKGALSQLDYGLCAPLRIAVRDSRRAPLTIFIENVSFHVRQFGFKVTEQARGVLLCLFPCEIRVCKRTEIRALVGLDYAQTCSIPESQSL